MPFECIFCNYKTEDRTNFYHHKKTKKHLEKSSKSETPNEQKSFLPQKLPFLPPLPHVETTCKVIKGNSKVTEVKEKIIENLECLMCNRNFNHKSNLSRHKKTCKKKEEKSNNEEILKIQLENEKRINQILCDMLNNANVLVNKTTNIANNAQNVSLSAINYANKVYKDAPILKPMENFKINNLDYDKENEKAQLLETIIYYSRTNSLHKLLGDHIVKHYKKEKPEEQMFHTTDVARLSYIVKQIIDEASEKNNYTADEAWQKDPSGKEICKFIIEPLIKKIVEYLGEYQKELFKKNPVYMTKDEKETMKIICDIIIEDEIGQLCNSINRYIAPYFNLKKKEIENTN
jgi:hypothetical protein